MSSYTRPKDDCADLVTQPIDKPVMANQNHQSNEKDLKRASIAFKGRAQQSKRTDIVDYGIY